MNTLGMTTRSPEQHRHHVAGLDIEPDPVSLPAKPRASKAPRHRAIARDLAGLRIWMEMKGATPDTAWLVGDNDNHVDAASAPNWASRQEDAQLEMVPTARQMMDAIAGAVRVIEGEFTILGGLRFKAGKLVAWRTSPSEPWKRPTEKYDRHEATTAGERSGNRAIRAIMLMQGDWEAQRGERDAYVAPCSDAPLGPSRTAAWRCAAYDDDDFRTRRADRDLLASIDTTGIPVTRCPSPALPSDERLADAFHAFRVRGVGSVSVIPNGPQETAIIRREERAAASHLAEHDAIVLNVASAARTMADVGKVLKFTGKAAERQGRRALMLSSRNLEQLVLAA